MSDSSSTRFDATAEISLKQPVSESQLTEPPITFASFEIETQIGSGRDAISYRGIEKSTGRVAEVRLLRDVSQVAKRIRLAALVRSPICRRLIAFDVESSHEPFIAFNWLDGQPLGTKSRSLSISDAVALAIQVASVVATCHELGFAIGRLLIDDFAVDAENNVWIDITGLDAGRKFGEQTTIVVDTQRTPLPEDDLQQLAIVIGWLATGDQHADPAQVVSTIREVAVRTDDGFANLLTQLALWLGNAMSADPFQRPPAGEVADLLNRILVRLPLAKMFDRGDSTVQTTATRFGRFRVVRELGRGGMGTVYEAEDLADGTIAAVKVLNPETQRDPTAIARFRREAKLLAEIASPFVARLLDVNVSDGLHYLAMEYVNGKDLSEVLKMHSRLPERLALRLLADMSRALSEAHSRGIVHRDIKPANVLLVDSEFATLPSESELERWRVKVVDFGLARRSQSSQSMDVTRSDAFVGTPAYMAPEQTVGGGIVDARADIYSLGCTLYEMLCGRPPFESNDVMALVFKHSYESHKAPQELNSDVSDGAARLIDRCLAKRPDGRFADAGALLVELERLLRGEATQVYAHPILPPHDPRKIVNCDWRWELNSSPESLWPLVSNTERLNRAAGFPPVEYSTRSDPEQGTQLFGQFRLMGQLNRWRERPYEWIEGRRMAVLREFEQGPFEWFLSRVELTPRPDGGTTLRHQVQVVPKSFLGRLFAYVGVERNAKRALESTYRRMDAVIQGQQSTTQTDPFEAPIQLRRAMRRRLDTRLDRVVASGIPAEVAERLGEFLVQSPAQQVARIRPLALAEQLNVEPNKMVEACLYAAREGIMNLYWDILCPSCRIASEIKDTLRAIQQHGRCEACNLDFEVDWTKSIEMIFRVHPEIREAELRTFCIGGPQHFPHVVAQLRVQPGEILELESTLGPGEYVIRGPQLPRALPVIVDSSHGVTRSDIVLPPRNDERLELKAGSQWLSFSSTAPVELLIRIERTASRRDAYTAAQASTLPLFRDLFPNEVLSEGQLATVANLTYVFARYVGLDRLASERGDAMAFSTLHSRRQQTNQIVRANRGTMVASEHHADLAVFHSLTDGVSAAIETAKSDVADAPRLGVAIGVHFGPSLVVTRDGRIDYFGKNVDCARELAEFAPRRTIVLSWQTAGDPLVAGLLRDEGLNGKVVSVPNWDEERSLQIDLPVE